MSSFKDKNAKIQNDVECLRRKCKCGHVEYIYSNTDYILCTWCGNYIFKDKETEFKYRIKERIRKNV